jgi:cystathionine beta-lyase/cystathionine gamma-synthase
MDRTTALLHAKPGDEPEGQSGIPLVPPIYQSATFEFETGAALAAAGKADSTAFFYTRYGNPTQAVFEEQLRLLEGAEVAYAFSSGMAALSAVFLGLLRAGDTIAVERRVYGGTLRLARDLLARFGVTVRWLEGDAEPALSRTLEGTKLVIFETPTNPLLDVLDVRAIARAARKAGSIAVLDATFATPMNFRGLDLGCDVVVHSATKYLNGHHDVVAGIVAGPRALLAPVAAARRLIGGTLDPHAAYLVSRGMKTLPLRVARQNETALALARALEGTPGVRRVRYPGLASHPRHALARELMPAGQGGVLSIELEGGREGVLRTAERLAVARLAASLGGTETLVSPPVITSHAGLSDAELATAGIDPGLLRIAVGLEHPDDLIADFRQAIAGAR